MRRLAYEFIIVPILTIIIVYLLYLFFSYSISHSDWNFITTATRTPHP